MVRRQTAHLEGRSKAARQAQRRNLGPLRNLTVQSKTRDRYNKALEKYKNYLKDEGRVFPRDAAGHDYLLSQYIEFLWETGEGRALACDTIASVQDQQPAIRGHLPSSSSTSRSSTCPCRLLTFLGQRALWTLLAPCVSWAPTHRGAAGHPKDSHYSDGTKVARCHFPRHDQRREEQVKV